MKNKHPVIKKKWNLGQRASDRLTKLVGSWVFITIFFIFIAIWMTLNIVAYMNHWDPYPFILLNFVLSCLAAIQAPIILMSQNREQEKDRIKLEYDYKVNRKAEREIVDMQKDLDEIKALIRKRNKRN